MRPDLPKARARMKTPESLVPALDAGVIQEVVRPLMSGKEALVYLVMAGGEECVAKVYKEASQRTFKHRSTYTEGRRTRNSRDQRAVNKRSHHGKSQDEAGWRRAEVDMIHRLHDAGVRVPAMIDFVDGVVVMELVKDAEGDPAPRLSDLDFSSTEARKIYRQLLREVTRMLCAGVVHGDLSEFNVLMGADGPVVIDFPQAIDAAHNQGARKLLLRDVENLHRFAARYAAGHRRQPFGEEMWSLYESNRLQPDHELRGDYRAPKHKADTGEVLALIEDADREQRDRRIARGEDLSDEAPTPLRKVVDFSKGRAKPPPRQPEKAAAKGPAEAPKRRRPSRRRKTSTEAATEPKQEKQKAASGEAAAPRRRKRPRRRRSGSAQGGTRADAPADAERSTPNEAVRPATSPARKKRRRRRRPGSRGTTST